MIFPKRFAKDRNNRAEGSGGGAAGRGLVVGLPHCLCFVANGDGY